MVGLAYQTERGLDMTLSTGDMFALTIALLSVNMVLLVAFRRVYVLERRLRRYEGYYDAR
jgi:hypothetical protein